MGKSQYINNSGNIIMHVGMSIGSQKQNSGFTLIELMVSLTIFSIVMLISTGTLLTLIDVNAKAQALYMATTNLSFALDIITRDIRTGHAYYCAQIDSGNHYGQDIDLTGTSDCSGKTFISFTRDWSGERVSYRFRSGDASAVSIEQRVGDSSQEWYPITSSQVTITRFDIIVDESSTTGGANNDQPTITLKVAGYINNGLDTDTDFNIQSHIVSRRLDIAL